MAVKIKSNVAKQASRLDAMTGPDADILAGMKLTDLAKRYTPLFSSATPKVSGEAAESIEVKLVQTGKDVKVVTSWGVDYIADVNNGDGKNAGFADNQFKSIANRLNAQAKFEIGKAYAEAGKKNKLKVKR